MKDKIQQKLEEMAEEHNIDLLLLTEQQYHEMYLKAEKSLVDRLAAFGDMMRDRTKEGGDV